MLTELINFTNTLSDDFKDIAFVPSKGLHIFVGKLDSGSFGIRRHYYYDGKKDLNNDLKDALFYEKYSSYISMNQQQKFDPKQKIHSSSPFSLAFNFSLGSKKKEIVDTLKKEIEYEYSLKFTSKNLNKEDKQKLNFVLDKKIKELKIGLVKESIENYFANANHLCSTDQLSMDDDVVNLFENYCKAKFFNDLYDLEIERTLPNGFSKKVSAIGELKEKDYVRVYLSDIGNAKWKQAYKNYYLLEYPQDVFNQIDFLSNYPSKKPFKLHQTAYFDSFKINGKTATVLKEFKALASSDVKILPNPLPIFIFQDENFERDFFALCRANEERIKYREIIERLYLSYKHVFQNYYLINWYKGKDIEISDYDFVAKFKYETKDASGLEVKNLFKLYETKEKGNSEKYYSPIKTIFELEEKVLKYLIQNKYHRVDYFSDFKKEDYDNNDLTFLSFCKYRKAVYDYVYKSNQNAIGGKEFDEMVFNAIKDDFKNNNEYGIKEKLNYWYSLCEHFHQPKNKEQTMASKLQDYQDFVAKAAINEADLENASDEELAFAAGQIIEYLIDKSETSNKNYQLLEPYLQKSKCSELKISIANDVARYKHAINTNETRFKNVFAAVETWETKRNIKDLLPELISGLFAKNQFFNLEYNKNNNQ